MDVDQPRHDHQARGVEDLGAAGVAVGDPLVETGDAAVLDQQIARGVEPLRGIDHAAAADQEPRHAASSWAPEQR